MHPACIGFQRGGDNEFQTCISVAAGVARAASAGTVTYRDVQQPERRTDRVAGVGQRRFFSRRMIVESLRELEAAEGGCATVSLGETAARAETPTTIDRGAPSFDGAVPISRGTPPILSTSPPSAALVSAHRPTPESRPLFRSTWGVLALGVVGSIILEALL